MNDPEPTELRVLDARFAVVRLAPDAKIPDWVRPQGGELFSLTRTAEETSLVVDDRRVPPGVRAERGFAALMVRGPLDFDLVGVLARLCSTLAEFRISVFALSTYDTDYVLLKDGDLARARRALLDAGYTIQGGR